MRGGEEAPAPHTKGRAPQVTHPNSGDILSTSPLKEPELEAAELRGPPRLAGPLPDPGVPADFLRWLSRRGQARLICFTRGSRNSSLDFHKREQA